MQSTQQAIQKVFYPATFAPARSDQIAIIQAAGNTDGSDRVITFSQFQSLQCLAVERFKENGVEAQDRVLLSSPNSPESAAAICALWRIGAVAAPVDFRLTEEEVENVANHMNVKMICASSRFNPNLKNSYGKAKAQLFDLAQLSEHEQRENAADTGMDVSHISTEKAALIILTSGTTGVPKGAVHDLHTLMTNVCQFGPVVELGSGTRILLPLPISHIFGMEVLLTAIIYGSTVLFTDLSPQSFFTCAKKYEPDIYTGVPTLYGAMMALPAGSIDLSRSRHLISGGAPLPLSLAEDFERRFGKRLANGYGSTESKIIALNIDGPRESVGRIIRSVVVNIVDEQGKPVEPGQTGQITIAGPCLMMGYLDNPEATAKVIENGHYLTGDMGCIKDEYLYICGRSKEMIVVAGNKVFPNEVEDVLRQSSLVKEVAVVGVPNKQLGQIVKAIVVINSDEASARLTAGSESAKAARQELSAQLKEHCKQRLKRELRPMEYEFRSVTQTLPKTSSGKIDKKQLWQQAIASSV